MTLESKNEGKAGDKNSTGSSNEAVKSTDSLKNGKPATIGMTRVPITVTKPVVRALEPEDL